MAKVATDYLLEAGGLDAGVLRVTRFHGSEALSELFRFDVELVADADEEIKFDDIVGEKAKLTWNTAEGERWLHGIVARLEHTGQGKKTAYYALRLVPRVWTLTLKHQCRIFQDMTTPDIVKKVLKDAGIPGDGVDMSVKRSYKARKYCVQYRESDFDFISRLMEEEGMFYFFLHTEDGHTMKIADDKVAHVAIEGEATLPFHEGESGMEGTDEVRRLRYARSVRSGAVMLRDYDPRKPSLDLKAESKADVESHLEIYDYPGEFPDTSMGADLSKIRLEELRSERERATGDSNCRRLAPGLKFTLEGHPLDAFNKEYLLTRVQHFGEQPQAAGLDQLEAQDYMPYQNEFECMPAAVPFRPPRLTPRPRVDGPQTALVTGPKGEEIHTDEHGRIKVHFHWDREGTIDDKSSCWIRVSQGWGGGGWGSVFIPRIGHEVIIEFIEGDPDRPLCTGRVYNGNNPPPYGLPGAKTMSSIKSNSSPGGGGSNEIRFEDASGGEEVFVHAQKDYNDVVENNRTRLVKNNETLEIKKNRDKKVGVDQSEDIGSNKKIKVGASHKEEIGTTMDLKVGDDCTEKIGGSRKITVSKTQKETITATETQNIGGAKTVRVGGSYKLQVGATMAEKVKGSRTENVGGQMKLEVKGNLSEAIKGNRTEKVDGKMGTTVKGAWSQETEATGIVKAKGDLGITTEANLAVKGKKIAVAGEDQITLTCGDASIELKKNGDITINGKKISIKGSGDVVVKGSKVTHN